MHSIPQGLLTKLSTAVERSLALSTAHITEEDNELFDAIYGGRRHWNWFVVYELESDSPGEMGWQLYIPDAERVSIEELDEVLCELGFSEALRSLVRYTRALGCRYLVLDPAANDFPDDLPTFEW
jgi:hypothetical protein